MTLLALAAVAAALLTAAVAAWGVRAERVEWGFATGTLLGRAVPALALAALIAGGVGSGLGLAAGLRAGVAPAAVAVMLGAAVLLALAEWRADQRRAALTFAPVHDVATDWRDPLMPSLALQARRGPRAQPIQAAPALAEGPSGGFLGRPVAEVNATSCPEARPLVLPVAPSLAYRRVRAAAERAGVRLVTDDPAVGVLEGVAPAPIAYGGHADVLARVRPDGAGARLDLRSVSRHGAVDGGTNCRRVAALRAAVAAR